MPKQKRVGARSGMVQDECVSLRGHTLISAVAGARVALVAALSAGIVVGCQPATEPSPVQTQRREPLTNGSPDDADPAVVGIVFADEPTQLRCTGTAISERVVLTAAHCDVQNSPASFEVFFGADVKAAGKAVRLIQAVAHPDFDETATHDLALLLLAEPSPAAAEALLAEPVLAAPPPVSLRLVGFGDTGAGADDNGRKREGTTRTTEVTDYYVELGADPSLPCNGDSGGPAFVVTGAGSRLAAVVSRGDATCATYGKATRVDVHRASFIEPYVAATAPGAMGLGEPCLYDDHCGSGLCVEALDEPLLRFCSKACVGDGDCSAPLACQAAECRYPFPSPGAVGAPCVEHGDCLRGECLDEGWCSLRCVSGRGDCPTGYECEHLGGIDFFCMPVPPAEAAGEDGGCAVGRAGERESAAWAGLLLALLLLGARVGRRQS